MSLVARQSISIPPIPRPLLGTLSYPMLPSRVFVQAPSNPETEDIFSSSLSSLFTDDTQNSHGTPGHSVIYKSPRYGDINLAIPQHPDVEEGRKLFAHYLWNAGIVAAEAIESASYEDDIHDNTSKNSSFTPTSTSTSTLASLHPKAHWNKEHWNLRNKTTLELGAGTALPSLIAALSHAHSTTITDYPSSPSLVNDTIAHNVAANLQHNNDCNPTATTSASLKTTTPIAIHGLTWGDPLFTSPVTYGLPSRPQPAHHSFERIIIADCLWMPNQHRNLVDTIDLWLTKATTSESEDNKVGGKGSVGDGGGEGCALITAGFHTGRAVVAAFFEEVVRGRGVEEFSASGGATATGGGGSGLRVEEIFEVDVDLGVREWKVERVGESKEEAKKWVVCAVVKRVVPELVG